MSLDRAINILVTITLIEMMVLLGLQVTFTELAQAAKNWWLLARAAMANYVLFPAVTIALLMLFDVGPMLAAGFLVLAVCPGAPYGPRFAVIACANVPIAVGLMAILAGTSTIVSPALLHVLLPWVSGGEAPQIDMVGMLGALLATQLLPLLLGLTVKHRRPQFANRLLTSARDRQQRVEPERRRTHLGHPIPYADGHPNCGLRRDADFVGREPSASTVNGPRGRCSSANCACAAEFCATTRHGANARCRSRPGRRRRAESDRSTCRPRCR